MSRSPSPGPERAERLDIWLRDVLNRAFALAAPIADASLRRYLRLETDDTTYVVMDAPDQTGSLASFVHIAERLANIGVKVPTIHAQNRAEGFLLLSDLGARSYLDTLDAANADRLYEGAIETLLQIQTGASVAGLPDYDDAFLGREMEMFVDWFLDRHLGIGLSRGQREIVDQLFTTLAKSAAEQPQCFVHRDYHSRNLIIRAGASPGVLDFQDAVAGPITYDLVSLLRDVYIVWPDPRVDGWKHHYHEHAQHHGLLAGIDYERFSGWFDLMGAQRHLKIPGIFSRLYYRDGKPGYLEDIPAALGYLERLAERHEHLAQLHYLLQELDVGQQTIKRNREVLG